MEVRGVSWRPHTPPGHGDQRPWSTHVFGEEQWHTAGRSRLGFKTAARQSVTRIMHSDPGCRVCAAEGPGQLRTGEHIPEAYPNPLHAEGEGGEHGLHWYHGTASNPARGRIERRNEHGVDDSPTHNTNGKYGARADMHWNTDLGVHFSAHHHVAHDDFAANGDNGGGEHARVAHATLHMRNPAVYKSEHQLTDHAITWAHAKGFRYLPKDPHAQKAFVNGHWHVVDQADKEEGPGRSYGYHKNTLHTDDDRARIVNIDRFGPKAYMPDEKEKWIAHHPERERINDEFRAHLQSKGHDGIVYGNEYEGPKGHPSAIAFPSTPIKVDRTEWVH